MSRVVHKWPLTQPEMAFAMVADTEVLTVHEQNGVPTIWTIGSTTGLTRLRLFVGFATGQLIDDEGLTYIGTAHNIEGELVFHIFERVPTR